ncbi:MAG TPA: protein kinase, partial [Thermoanaerobaculia bacterium]
YSIEEIDGVRFLTMELVEGETLDTRIALGPAVRSELLDLAIPIADALRAAHEKGIAHRDLKPSNIMIGKDGRVRILDFGLARVDPVAPSGAATQAPTISQVTQQGAIVGTVPYMSPEQLRGESADARSDLFSFGVVLYELATGRRPFRGTTTAEVFSAILRDDPPAVNDPALDRVLRRCLAKHPGDRHASAAGLADDLRRLQGSSGGPTPSPAEDPSIAVLPFADMSPARDQDYLCEGIAEEILNVLTRVEGLRVVSRMSAFQFKQTGGDSRDIGRRLGVSHLLEGSVRKAGDRLRITAQLIETSGGFHLWSERFDRSMEDIFAIQDEIAESSARALRLQLDRRRVSDAAPSPNVEAYETYLRAWQYFHRHGRKEMALARGLLRRATEIDAGYARAWAAIAEVSAFLYQWFGANPADLDEADAASRRAVELAPSSAEAHAARAMVASLRQRFAEARSEFETAIAADPTRYETLYEFGRFFFIQGRLEEAVAYFDRAAAARPEEYQAKLLAAQGYEALGRREEALSTWSRGLEAARTHLELNPDETRALYLGAGALLSLGRLDEARQWQHRAEELDPEDAIVHYSSACFHARLGEREAALAALERALSYPFGQRSWIEHDSELASIRDDPRFRALMEGLPRA